ncbi:hypothetical protein FACS1894182_05450 [Bacteroidia bacterium]|nr:hypothetical protein FACS1894182_05450 [Bacteroidia bacterium]
MEYPADMYPETVSVSLIVPVYNVSDYVVRCIKSIVGQSYTHLECLIVDDGSSDNSMDLIHHQLESYRGPIIFRFFHHECNRGLSEARNTGIAHARGDYLFFLDSDDELPPSGINVLVELVEKYPGIEMVVGNMHTLPALSGKTDIPHIAGKSFPEYSCDNDWMNKRFYRHIDPIPVNACSKLVKRSFIVDNGLFFRAEIIYEDALWMFFVLKKLHSIAFCEKDSYIRHVREGSIMQSTDTVRSLKSWLVILQEVFNHLDKAYSNDQRKKYYRILFLQMAQIDLHSEESEFYPFYKALVKSLFKKEILNQPVLLTLSLCILLMPQSFYQSFIMKKIVGLCLKLT